MRVPTPFTAALTFACSVLWATGCVTIRDSSVSATVGPIRDQWVVQWNDALGTPARMTNRSLQDVFVSRETPSISDSAAQEAVRGVLRDNVEWFRIRPGVDDLVVVSSHSSEWLRVVKLQQRYRGIPVVGGGYEARVFPNGRVGSLEGRFQPDLGLSVTPGLGEQQAESQAQAVLVAGAFRGDVPILRLDAESALQARRSLVILPIGEGQVLAWGILVEPSPQERWRVYVDALTGEVKGRQFVSGGWAR